MLPFFAAKHVTTDMSKSAELSGGKPEGQTTGVTDTKVPETPSRGRSQASLYNDERPHSGIGQIVPILLHETGGASSPSSAKDDL